MIALVGEAYGAEEAKEGKPFVGKAGQQLDRLLAVAGINRSKCLVTTVANERPPSNNFGVYYEDSARKKPTERLLEFHKQLKERVKDCSVVIALGEEALFALTGKKEIEKYHGSIMCQEEGYKVVPTFHPEKIMRGGGTSFWYAPTAINDLIRALEVECRDIRPSSVEVRTTANPEELKKFLEKSRQKAVSVDIETVYHYRGEEVSCIGFSSRVGEALVVTFLAEGGRQLVTPTGWEDFKRLIGEFFASEEWGKVGQNIQFDINVLRRVGLIGEVRNISMDTMVAHANCVQPEFPHGLDFLTSYYTLHPYYKDARGTEGEKLYQYNGTDAAVTLEVYHELLEEMEEYGTLEFYEKIIHPLLPIMADINFHGIRINKEYRKELKKELAEEIVNLKAELDEVTEGAIENHRSSVQVREYLYTNKKYPVRMFKGRPTSNEVALKRILLKTGDPAIAILLKLREKEKQLTTYVNIKTDEHGTVRTMYSFAKTGRFRSGRYEE